MPDACGWFPMDSDEIRRWAEAHRESLPRNLEEMAQYPMAFRRVLVNMVPATVRAEIWCDHLRSFLGPHSELSESDQEYLREVIADLPPAFIGPADEARAYRDALNERTGKRFAPELAARLFKSLGPPEPPGGLPLPADAQVSVKR